MRESLHDAPTLDTALIPGIRRGVSLAGSQAATSASAFATQNIPAKSILRTLLFAAEGVQSVATGLFLRLAYGATRTPLEGDFVGSQLVWPTSGFEGQVSEWHADPAGHARDFPVNLQLPDTPGRLLLRIENDSGLIIRFKIQMVIDSLIRLGDDHGRR